MRRTAAILVVLVCLSLLFIAGTALLTSPTSGGLTGGGDDAPSEKRQAEMVHPTGGESSFWPYLSPRKGFSKRSPINVVVIGDSDQVRRALVESGDADWQVTDNETAEADASTYALVGGDAANATNASADDAAANGSETGGQGFDAATAVGWGSTSGATRYAYVDPGPNESGRWVAETDQLHDGTYYGSRYHIRLYESPADDERWVAMQTHSEHFDWFTLRHRVSGSQDAQAHLEGDLMALPSVNERTDVRRVYLDNSNRSDADGWATFVDLVGALLVGVAGAVAGSHDRLRSVRERVAATLTDTDRERLRTLADRADKRHLATVVVVVGIVLGVRMAGIALEETGVLSMHAIAALLYPVLALGLPLATYLIATGIERRLDAALVASASFAVAVWLDYGFLGVTTLPVEVLVQRAYMFVALGLVAAGAAKRATRERRLNALVVIGGLLWAVVLVGTLLGKF
jgi:hypothetical protein